MSQAPPSKHRTDLDNIRYDLLCGLMASTPLPAVDEAIFRRLLFSGSDDIRTKQVQRSLPSLAEGIGRDSVDGIREVGAPGHDSSEQHNRQVQAAHRRLRAPGGLFEAVRLNKQREGKGRGYKYHHVLVGRFEGCTEPNTPLAYWAAKRMAIQVSPLGPSLEQTWNRVWWHLGSDNERTQPLNEWAEDLGLSRATALRHLRELGRSNVGMAFEELPPEPRTLGQIGRSPMRFRITAELPPKGKLPDGAKRHRERQRQEEEMLAELKPAVETNTGALYYVDGPDGMVAVSVPDDDYVEHLPPWADEEDDAPAETTAKPASPDTAVEDDAPEVPGEAAAPADAGATEAVDELAEAQTPAEIEEPDTETSEPTTKADKLRLALNKRLHDAAEANGQDDRKLAGEILKPVLSAIPTHIAKELFGGDQAEARSIVIEAFKRGQHSLGGAVTRTPDDWAVDYLPESSKPHAARLALEGEPASATATGSGSSRPARPVSGPISEAMDRVPLSVGGRVENYGHEDLPEGVGEAEEGGADDKSEPEVVGVQLTLEGGAGRELVRGANGKLRYRKATPAGKSTAGPSPELLDELREEFGLVETSDVEVAVASVSA